MWQTLLYLIVCRIQCNREIKSKLVIMSQFHFHTLKDAQSYLYHCEHMRVSIGTLSEWRGASPPAACQTLLPADPPSFLVPCALSVSLSPVPADAAPHERAPAGGDHEEAAGHARHWQEDVRNETPAHVAVFNTNRTDNTLMWQGFFFYYHYYYY